MNISECMFIAGDPSGDKHSAPVIKQLKLLHPHVVTTGIGGPHMVREGFHQLLPFEPFNKMGFAEVLLSLPFFLSAKKFCSTYLKKHRPACLICVDYSGFNIPMMKAAASLHIPVVWYITPMVWAWKKKRSAVLGRYATHICCIFPFEVAHFKPFSNSVHFVGNPVVEDIDSAKVRGPAPLSISDPFTVGFVPGSRRQEVACLLPVMVAAYKKLKLIYPHCRGIVSRHASLDPTFFSDAIKGTDLETTSVSLLQLFEKTSVAVVTSGTATLEAALSGIPHVIVYKTSALTYALLKHLVVAEHIGLPNIIAEERVAPELIQEYVTDDGIVKELDRFVTDKELYTKTVHNLIKIRELLGSKKPSVAVAEIIGSVLRKS